MCIFMVELGIPLIHSVQNVYSVRNFIMVKLRGICGLDRIAGWFRPRTVFPMIRALRKFKPSSGQVAKPKYSTHCPVNRGIDPIDNDRYEKKNFAFF